MTVGIQLYDGKAPECTGYISDVPSLFLHNSKIRTEVRKVGDISAVGIVSVCRCNYGSFFITDMTWGLSWSYLIKLREC